jgi:hypothetical protein
MGKKSHDDHSATWDHRYTQHIQKTGWNSPNNASNDRNFTTNDFWSMYPMATMVLVVWRTMFESGTIGDVSFPLNNNRNDSENACRTWNAWNDRNFTTNDLQSILSISIMGFVVLWIMFARSAIEYFTFPLNHNRNKPENASRTWNTWNDCNFTTHDFRRMCWMATMGVVVWWTMFERGAISYLTCWLNRNRNKPEIAPEWVAVDSNIWNDRNLVKNDSKNNISMETRSLSPRPSWF